MILGIWRRLRAGVDRAQLAKDHIARCEYAAAAEQLAILSRLEPANASWPAAQADCHARAGDMQAAALCLEAALSLVPRESGLWTKLGYARWELALVDEAIAAYRRAVDCDPRAEPAGGNLLFALLHRAEAPGEYLAEAQRWAQHVPATRGALAHANAPDPERRLRVGYVSADLRNHAMAPFIEAMLAGRDAQRFDVVCYDGTPQSDAVSARLRSYGALWRHSGRLNDTAFASQIKADAVDILVDLSGHTAGNRLRTFMLRPAPIQVCNHGCPATTGLDCFDWRLTDWRNDPPGAEAYYTEPLYRLQEFSFCYRPAAAAPVPRAADGPLTFASLNNVRKITPRMVALWSRILQQTPQSRLLIAGTPPGPARERIATQLSRAGIGAQRLDFRGWLPYAQYASLHGMIDIALDTYPYNGSTTTFEALYHGVPVVSLAGAVFVSRHGRAALETLGEERLAAETDEAYVTAAVRLAREDLRSLRPSLQARMRASPMLDGDGYVSRLQGAYRDMWRKWCAARA